MAGAAIQELLDQAVGVDGGGPSHTGGAAVEAQATAEEMHRHGAGEALDGINATADFGAGGGGEQAEVQLAQQR